MQKKVYFYKHIIITETETSNTITHIPYPLSNKPADHLQQKRNKFKYNYLI